MFNKTNKLIAIFLFFTLFLAGSFSVIGQVNPEQERANLERQLRELETRILSYERDVTKTQAQRESLQHELNIFRRRMNQLNAQIRQSQNMISSLTGEIRNKEVSIDVTIDQIEDLRGRLAGTLRVIHQEDKKSTIEVLLSERNLSNFFDNSFALENLSHESRNLLGEIMILRVNLEEEKISLDNRKGEAEQAARLQALQAEETRRLAQTQETLLRQTQQRETTQKQELRDLRRQASEIRARMFQLAGTPTTQAPTFGEAYETAQWVEGITGVRPAFLLGILHQESGIGRNVGQCFMKDAVTAHGVNIRTGAAVGAVMKPMGLPGRKGDVEDFLIITRELGLDPFNTAVSCPIPSVGGWGGAMGPAQFIPTTWMRYRARLAAILGRPANPWNIRDSFLASGLYLSDLGAGGKTRQAEWCAAQGYFTGIRCNSNHAFYGNSVLAHAERFQRDINILDQSR